MLLSIDANGCSTYFFFIFLYFRLRISSVTHRRLWWLQFFQVPVFSSSYFVFSLLFSLFYDLVSVDGTITTRCDNNIESICTIEMVYVIWNSYSNNNGYRLIRTLRWSCQNNEKRKYRWNVFENEKRIDKKRLHRK